MTPFDPTLALQRVSRRAALVRGATATVATTLGGGLMPSRMATGAVQEQATVPSEIAASEIAAPMRLPHDDRLGPLKDLDGYFPFQSNESRQAWEERRALVKRQILVSCGLWPMPSRPPIEATVHGRVERDGYTVDRVFFESSPGLFVTGSLYCPVQPSDPSPSGAQKKFPAILCPHGHFPQGRFHDHGPDVVAEEIAAGAEKFPIGGRHPLQSRCVQLARMGCIVFMYDMQGYADGGSLPLSLVHRFAEQRPQLSSPQRWGLFSAQSELRLINALGLQTWNSIRALDWIASRDDVDAQRIGATGASGGGTQTFLLAALDDRVAAAFPAVMVSTAMQGGCTCENATYLRINSGNIEFAALIAPRPLGLTGANDWTVEIETKGLPELQTTYGLYGSADRVTAKYLDFPHNYNAPSRALMYAFFNRHLALGADSIEEQDFVPLSIEEATVFNDSYPAPANDETAETALLSAWDRESQSQLAALRPTDEVSFAEFRRVVGGAYQSMIGRGMLLAQTVVYEQVTEVDHGPYRTYTAWLRLAEYGEELPSAFVYPAEWNRQAVVWISGKGKRGLLADDGRLRPAVLRLVRRGFAVAAVDLLYQGDFLADGRPLEGVRWVDNPREFLGHTSGYNHPLFAQRVHDILTLLSFVKHHPDQPEQIHLAGVDGAGILAAGAAAISSDALSSLALDTEGFRFATLTDIRDVRLLPGALKYGDVPALVGLAAPTRLLLGGEPELPSWTADAYRAARGRAELSARSGAAWPDALADWLCAARE